MAHFCELDENNVVLRVIVVHDNDAPTEEAGIQFCQDHYGKETKWIKTSYNTEEGVHKDGKEPFRHSYGRPGYSYDEKLDAFIPPQPYPSWTWNEKNLNWDPPFPSPYKKHMSTWDEKLGGWRVGYVR